MPPHSARSRRSTPVRTRERFLVFGAPQLGEAEMQEVVASMRSGWLGTGPKVSRFEREFASYQGAREAAAVNSCTAALHLALVCSGIGPGDEVITTPLTFCATVNSILHTGATPVFCDVDPRTQNIDAAQLERHVTRRTKAILPVHFAGRPCEMDAILAVAKRHELRVIEDCAHAIETEFHGRRAGTFGDFGCFSFYVTKNLTTGEGGMLLAKRARDLQRARVLSLHGMDADAWKRFGSSGWKHYAVRECGFKYNMMDLQAAIGLHQLKRIERNWWRRRQIWQRYSEAFADLPLELPAAPAARTRHAHHLYTVLVDRRRAGLSRDAFLAGMKSEGIGVGVHYLSIPEHPLYKKRLGVRASDTPVAQRIGRQTVSLPLSPRLDEDDVEDVIAAVRKVLG